MAATRADGRRERAGRYVVRACTPRVRSFAAAGPIGTIGARSAAEAFEPVEDQVETERELDVVVAVAEAALVVAAMAMRPTFG